MLKSKLLKFFSIILLLGVVASSVYLCIKTNMNLSEGIADSKFYNYLTIGTLGGIFVLGIMATFIFLNKIKPIYKLTLITNILFLVTSVYYFLLSKMFLFMILAGVCTLIVLIICIISATKKENPDRYIRIDENAQSPLREGQQNVAQREFEKNRNNSAFYSHKKVDARAYFEDKETKKKGTYQKGSFINVPTNNYENGFMENSNYANSRTNNAGKTFDFNPNPKNARTTSNMRDSINRNTTDVEALNEEFVKKYHSKNGL